MGNEWHYFGSHFFLPSSMRLGFFEDDFHGLLPQYYASVNGTSRADTPASAFNDLNQEDKGKYTHLLACDFVLTSDPAAAVVKRLQSAAAQGHSTPRDLRRKVTSSSVKPVIQTAVIDVDASQSTIARAFYLPGYSDIKNRYKNYTLFHLGS